MSDNPVKLQSQLATKAHLSTSEAPAPANPAETSSVKNKLVHHDGVDKGAKAKQLFQANPTTPTPAAKPAENADESLMAEVDGTIQNSLNHIRRIQGPDGIWQTAYTAGAFANALGIVALSLVKVPGASAGNKAVLAQLIDQQNADGSFSVYEKGPSSMAATLMMMCAMRSALDAVAGESPGWDAAFRAKVERDYRRAAAFVPDSYLGKLKYTFSTPEHRMEGSYIAMAWRVAGLLGVDKDLPALPDTLAAKNTVLTYHLAAGDRAPAGLDQVVPALALLSSHYATRTNAWSNFVADNKVLKQLPLAGKNFEEGKYRKVLEGVIQDRQGGDGAWLWQEMLTSLNLIALHLGGHGPDEPAMKKGIAFLVELRNQGQDGRKNSFSSSAWDTACMLGTLAHVKNGPMPKTLTQAVDKLIAAQDKTNEKDGRFGFSLEGGIGDSDTSAMVVKTLCEVAPRLPKEQRGRVAQSVERAILAFAKAQRDDGGFSAFESQRKSAEGVVGLFDPDGLMRLSVADESDAALSARVLMGLLSARNSSLLSPEADKEAQAMIARTVAYLKAARHGDNTWWSRWISGGLSSFAFVAPALRTSGVAPHEPWLADTREFILAHQNSDGGFGENVEADTDRAKIGKGKSTPAQTAFCIIGLIASMQKGDTRAQAALDKAAAFLVQWKKEHANESGFTNDRPLYTAMPGIDYYDAPAMTEMAVVNALSMYQDLGSHGAQAASDHFVLGR